MTVSTRIHVDRDTWLIMREFPQHPKAIVHRVTATGGDERYLLMTWLPDPSKRRLVGIHGSLDEAEAAVPWPSPTPQNLPPNPSPEDHARVARERAAAAQYSRDMSE